jgi:Tfp pilus assembly protein PilV
MQESITAKVGYRVFRGCRRLRSQRGSMLVEIMMSALLLALAATAVFKGIDGANATSGGSKSRAAATTLVQADQERMRSMDPRKLDGYTNTGQKVVNRVPYTVVSAGQVVSDRGDSESCSKGSGRVTFVRVTSTVTWPDMRGSKPISGSTLVSIGNAYSRGSLSIKIQDAHAVGVPGTAVNVTTPITRSGTTNSAGCVVWDGLSTGAYFGSFSKTGYVDPAGVSTPAPPNGWSVTTGSTGVYTQLYDKSGTANFKFVGKSGTNTYPDVQASGITLFHGTMPTPNNVRSATFPANNLVTFNALFPFVTPYSAWAGTCTDNMPPSGSAATVTVPPGGTASPDPINVTMPVINVRVLRGGSAWPGANITIRPAVAACGSTVSRINGVTDSAGLMPTGATAAGGPPERAFPFGSYIVCADDNRTPTTRRIEKTIANTSADGTIAPSAATDLDIPSSGSSSQGTC